jgi:hypothetical protein
MKPEDYTNNSPMIDLHPNGMVLRAGIPGNPKLRNWMDVYMDYLLTQDINIENVQLSIYIPSDGNWGHFKASKNNDEWEYKANSGASQDVTERAYVGTKQEKSCEDGEAG